MDHQYNFLYASTEGDEYYWGIKPNYARNMKELVMALLHAAFDKDEDVRTSVKNAIYELGKKQPALVVSSCLSYLTKHSKLSQGHRVVVYNAMEAILKDNGEDITEDLAVDIITHSLAEMIKSKEDILSDWKNSALDALATIGVNFEEVIPEWQSAPSGVLVAIGKYQCNTVMTQLLDKFHPGVLPHFFLIQTMANLAITNVFGMVPFLKSILGQMLPILGMAKQENMRWVIATAFAKFSESIVEYIANIEQAPDPNVKKESFSAEIDPAFDVLFQQWLGTREQKLRLAVVEALGHMSQISSQDKLEEQLPRLLPGVLTLYKKSPDPLSALSVTKGLCLLLKACLSDNSIMLDPHLEPLLQVLFQQMCQPIDYTNGHSIKNHNELLRCFAEIATVFSEKLIQFLLNRLEPMNEKTRQGALGVIRHLVNSCGKHLEGKHDLLLSGMKIPLGDSNNKVKKALAQTIIAMADHGYLELEGGQMMIEFIVMQCALQPEPKGKRPADPDYVSNEALRAMCRDVLKLLSTTVEHMDEVLWPYLLEYIVPEQYTLAMCALCKAITHVANRLKEKGSEDFMVDFDKHVNIPKPCAMLSRLLVMIGHPHDDTDRGQLALHTVQALGPILQEGLVELWENVIPKLLKYLEDHEESDEEWDQKQWEDLVLKMLSKAVEHVGNDEEWVEELADSFGEQIVLYSNAPKLKNFAYKCLGVVMRKSGKKDVVQKHLGTLFDSVKHTSQEERDGCAVAVGFAAASHLDPVLAKLDTIHKLDPSQKSSSLLNFFKGKSDTDEFTKSTVMLCYGYSTLYAPTDLITSRMEAIIGRTILPQFASVKEVSVKQNLVRAAQLIGEAMHPDHLKISHQFSYRKDFLQHMQNYLKAENPHFLTGETRKVVLNTCSTLVKLEPPLSSADQSELIKIALDSVLALPPGGIIIKKKEENYEHQAEQEQLMLETLEALMTLCKEIVTKTLTPQGLDVLFKLLYPWTYSESEIERERALILWLQALRLYLDKVKIHAGGEVSFTHLGKILACVVPRCTDPEATIRLAAIDCIHTALRIAMLYAGKPKDTPDEMIDALPTLKERLKKSDPNLMFSVSSDLSKVIAKKIPSDQVLTFLSALYQGLLDPQAQSSNGACVILNGVMKMRGTEAAGSVEEVLSDLHSHLSLIENGQTRQGTLRALRTLTTHHQLTVLNALLTYPIPHDEQTKAVFQILAEDKELTTTMLEFLLDTIARGLPYEEKPGRDKDDVVKVATLQPVVPSVQLLDNCQHLVNDLCTCIMKELIQAEKTTPQLVENYPRLLSALMVRAASSVACQPPKQPTKPSASKTDTSGKEIQKDRKSPSNLPQDVKVNPCELAVDTMELLVERASNEDMVNALRVEDVWAKLKDEETYAEGYTILARCLVNHQPEQVVKVVPQLTNVLSSVYDSQRVMVTAFFAELIKERCAGDVTLVDTLITNLMNKLVDSCHQVRRYTIRGLGNVGYVGAEQVQKFSTTVLSAMMSGMDDKEDIDDTITLESMSGLTQILAEIKESDIRAILINIALRIRPCFEKDKTNVRAAAFTLFGKLSKFCDGPSKEPFKEQITTNIVSLLLHLNDPEKEVKNACKTALRQIGPVMGSEEVNNMFQKFLIEDGSLHYGEFMNDLCKFIVKDFEDKLNLFVMGNVQFFKSNWPEIRANAALFAGFLLGNMPKEAYSNISREHVCQALLCLLKDPNSDVRCKASEAISLLHNI